MAKSAAVDTIFTWLEKEREKKTGHVWETGDFFSNALPLRYFDTNEEARKRMRLAPDTTDSFSLLDGLVLLKRYGTALSHASLPEISFDELVNDIDVLPSVMAEMETSPSIQMTYEKKSGTWGDLLRCFTDTIAYEIAKLSSPSEKTSSSFSGHASPLFPETVVLGFDKFSENIKAETGKKRSDANKKTIERQKSRDLNEGRLPERDVIFDWNTIKSFARRPATKKLPYPWNVAMSDRNQRDCTIRFICMNLVTMANNGHLAKIVYTKLRSMALNEAACSSGDICSPSGKLNKRIVQIVLDGHRLRPYDAPILRAIALEHIGKNRKTFVSAIIARKCNITPEIYKHWEDEGILPPGIVREVDQKTQEEHTMTNEDIFMNLTPEELETLILFVPIHLTLVFDEQLKIYTAIEDMWYNISNPTNAIPHCLPSHTEKSFSTTPVTPMKSMYETYAETYHSPISFLDMDDPLFDSPTRNVYPNEQELQTITTVDRPGNKLTREVNPYDQVKTKVERVGKDSFSRFEPNGSIFDLSSVLSTSEEIYDQQIILRNSHEMHGGHRLQTIIGGSRGIKNPPPILGHMDLWNFLNGFKPIFNNMEEQKVCAGVFSFVGDPNRTNGLLWFAQDVYPDTPKFFFSINENEVGEFDFGMFHILEEAIRQINYIREFDSSPENKRSVLSIRIVTIDTDALLQSMMAIEIYKELFNTTLNITMVNRNSTSIKAFAKKQSIVGIEKECKGLLYNITAICAHCADLFPGIKYPASTIAMIMSLKCNDYCPNFINGVSHESYLKGFIAYFEDMYSHEHQTEKMADVIIDGGSVGKWKKSLRYGERAGSLIPKNAIRTFDLFALRRLIDYIIYQAQVSTQRRITIDEQTIERRMIQQMYILYIIDDAAVGKIGSIASRTLPQSLAELYGFITS